MSKELALQESKKEIVAKKSFSMPSAQEMSQLTDFCKVMASAPFYQKLGPGGVMAIYLTAKEFNLPFMACLNGGMHVIEGKIAFSAGLINAMIVNAGHRVDVVQLDDTKCMLKFWRCDRTEKGYAGFLYEYTVKMAETAGYLNKTNWKSSRRDMLYNRALTGGGRKHMPEIFISVVLAGELVGTDADGDIAPDNAPIASPPKEVTFTPELIYQPPENSNSQENIEPIILPPEEIDQFYAAFNHEKENVKLYFKTVQESTGWSESAVILSAKNNPKQARTGYNKWLKNQTKQID